MKGLFVLCTALLVTLSAHAQDYPTKVITIVVPFPPGGGVDRAGRLIGDKLRDVLPARALRELWAAHPDRDQAMEVVEL